MKISIRHATTEDAKAIRALIVGVAGYFLEDVTAKEARDFFETVSVEALRVQGVDRRFTYLLAKTGGELAGVLAMHDNRHIHHLFVAAEFHRRGVGSALWEKAKRLALAAGNPGRFTLNSTLYAVPVYERWGFTATGEKVFKYGVEFMPMVLERRPGKAGQAEEG